MDCTKLINDISFFNNRTQICVFEKYKYLKNVQTIPWQYISRIIFYCDERPPCCICLNRLFLPRMDKCGHIFCLTCLLSLFNFHKTQSVLCPLCKTSELQKSNLKRVKLVNISDVKVGDDIVLRMIVKGEKSGIPLPGFKLVPAMSNVLSPTLESNCNYSYVSYDPDKKTVICIETDLQYLELRKESIINSNGEEIYYETKNFLNEECHNYECYNRVIDKDYEFIKNVEGDKFNLLSCERYLKSFDIYFQSPHKKYVLLYLDDVKRILDEYLCLRKIPPIEIKGKIISLEKEVINKEFMQRTNIKHMPLGSTVLWVKLDMSNVQYDYLYGNCLEKLRTAKVEMLRRERKAVMQEENNINQMPKKNENRKCSYIPDITRKRAIEENARFSNSGEEFSLECNVKEGFNTCTLGIECVVPDDLYPHSPDCMYYKKFEILNENKNAEVNVDTEEIFSNGSLTPTELDELSTKILSHSISTDAENSSNNVTEKNEELLEEKFVPDELTAVMVYEIERKQNWLNMYLVPRKNESQRELKNLRKNSVTHI